MPIESVLWAGPSATDAAIAEVEAAEGIKLPDDFRAFLEKYNGGRPLPDRFPIGPDNASLIDVLFSVGVGEGKLNDLQTMCDELRDDLPPSMMPIGRDAGGNIICLGVHGDARGRVFFLDTMNPRPAYEIAPSFAAFADSFQPRHNAPE